ncbi:YSIRK-type signal peptide-containing protein, partial [uncultured Gemella sp.]|uniref:YSIRK-type signal peptide-containing protein n=1 Tax=uncultured Gemella sp. TaxID=254352 RepID=UPI0028D4BB84
MERKEIFSIKKLKVGAASVLIGTGIVFLGSEASVVLANESVVETTVNRTNSDDVDDNSVSPKNILNSDKMGVNSSTTPQQVDTNSIKSTENNSNSSNVNTTSEVSDLENKTDIVDKKDMDIVTNKNRKKISKRSKRELTDSETIDYSGAKISGRLNDGKTQYAVGDQILGSYNLDVSSPTKIEEGGYILITASDNEPLDTFEIGSSLRSEKVNNNQYKLYTGELSGGAYANINVSYKLKKFETGKDSNTTIKAELFDKNNTLIKSTNFSNTNTTGTPYVSVDTRNGIRRQTLLETNQPETEIDVSKSKDLQLSLKSTNKEAAAITKIDHAVELPAGVTIAQTSLDAGWRLENGVAKYTRLVPSSTTMFASGDNTQNELLYLNVSNGGTPAEFLTGKKLTFKDNATYTDKSGFTNTTSDDVTVTVRAVNPKKSIGGSNSGSGSNPNNDQTNPSDNNSGTGGSTVPTKSDVQVAIFNETMEKNNSRVVNIAMPYIN